MENLTRESLVRHDKDVLVAVQQDIRKFLATSQVPRSDSTSTAIKGEFIALKAPKMMLAGRGSSPSGAERSEVIMETSTAMNDPK